MVEFNLNLKYDFCKLYCFTMHIDIVVARSACKNLFKTVELAAWHALGMFLK